MNIILASASPRRRDLLALAGIECELCPAGVDESPRAGEAPSGYVLRIAHAKAGAVAAQARAAGDRRPVLGADTAVVLDGRVFGKPADADSAARMLVMLSGRAHTVFSAVVVVCGARLHETVTETKVEFRVLEPAEIDDYVRDGEPLDKAGAYAIQGRAAAFVTRIDGSYSGVVGLPLSETVMLLRHCPDE